MRFRIDLKILIFFVCFYFTNQLNLYMCIMFFAFLHEIGHLLVGLILGLKPEKIEIMPFGFFLKFRPNTHDNKKHRIFINILVSAAGPITNFIIILIILFLHISFLGRDIAVYSNLLIMVFNLMPIYPLDGGRVLKDILEIFYGRIKSEIIINKISNAYMIFLTMIASMAIYYIKNIAIFLIIIYLWQIIIKDNKRIQAKIKALNFFEM